MGSRFVSDSACASLLPWPAEDANKYSRGKLVLAAGCAKYPGAACLAASAASRVGAGYVQVVCADEAAPVVRVWQPSLVVTPWSQGLASGSQPSERRPVAYVVGPGFDAHDAQCSQISLAVMQLAADLAAPLLVDGGALSVFSDSQATGIIRFCAELGVPAVLTPHGGEAVRLANALGVPTFAGQPGGVREQEDLARRLSQALRAVVVLKGPDTCIAFEEDVVVVDEGTSALAKAGTGDVLAGMIGGLLAQGLRPFDAAQLAVKLHARAGIVAAERMTSICVIPEDVLDAIPVAIKALSEAV
jgi:ADP-dependent NAD(P)H-hydrate dehydratase / NAD(P)H-hydrate epimerase